MRSEEAEAQKAENHKTLELCGDEPQRGFVCILRRGHEGDHACRTQEGFARLWWRRKQ